MKPYMYALCLGFAPAFAAVAPDTISDHVYFERSFGAGSITDQTIIFKADGTYAVLKLAWSRTADRSIVIGDPPPDGTYSYARRSDVDGVITFGDGSEMLRRFASPEGTAAFSDRPGRVISFRFVPLAARDTKPAQNISIRGFVAQGRPLICGLVIPTTAGTQEIMIRVVGPSLVRFGVSPIWADPDFQIFNGGSAMELPERHTDDWEAFGAGGGLRKIFAYVGAFDLLSGSKDAVDVVRLAPGAYTIICSPKGSDPGGEALIEAYFLP